MMTHPDATNASHPSAEHAPPPDRTGRVIGQWLSGTLCVFVVLTLLVNAAAALFIVPHMVVIFEDFDMELPTLTVALIKGRTAITLTSLLLAAGLVAKEVIIRLPMVKLVINMVVFLVTLGLVVVMVFGLFLPQVKLIQSMM